jgi:two-component system response regulator FixJ
MHTAQDKPTVFVVDDDRSVLDSLQLLLRSVGLDAETYSSASGFLEAYNPDRPGCMIVDVRMPGMSGLELQLQMVSMQSTLPIIFVTAYGDVPMAVQAVKAGAFDFIQKPFRDQELIDKTLKAIEHNARIREQRANEREIASRVASLTPRERQVMHLVLEGKANKVIARELDISQRTVEIHRARVMDKMQAGSVSELAQMAIRAGEEGVR